MSDDNIDMCPCCRKTNEKVQAEAPDQVQSAYGTRELFNGFR